AEAGMLYKTTLNYDADRFQPVTEYDDGRLRVGLTSEKGVKLRNRRRTAELDVALGPEAPLSLDLEFGAAQADIELGGLRIRRTEISTGASETSLRSEEHTSELQSRE